MIELLSAKGARLHGLLYRLTGREDAAEDLLQDLTLKLAESDGFAGADNPYAYARTAAMNLAFSWRRRARREAGPPVGESVSGSPPPWAGLIQAEEARRLLDAMQRLREPDRLMLTMRYFDGQSYEAVGREIGCTAQQARGRCHKAIRRLRAMMTGPGVSPGAGDPSRKEVAR